ncbi:hypothetical protein AB2L27_18005 [Kineococcus sp. LSe6-4]|uniref:Uncharacterized protein n=1 Tax=Kineococcus halophytocola TaxID=3234027 RepID=A0ABV4H8A6_9ACTN
MEHPGLPLSYVEDLEMFPRDPEHIPDWLHEKFTAAGRLPHYLTHPAL